jgi:autotransporter-associated beta strand protein
MNTKRLQKSSKFLATKFFSVLLCSLVLVGQTTFGATYTSGSTSGTNTWNSGTGWSGGVAPVSAADTSLVFGATLAAGTALQSDNNLVGDFLLNSLSMTYTGPGSGAVPTFTLTGGNLSFVNNGATTPTLSFASVGTIKTTETINNAIILSNTLTVSAAATGTTNNLGGVISGVGGLSKSGLGAVNVIGTANTFSGAVSIGNGALYVANIGNSGTNSSLGKGGTITLGSTTTAGELRTTNALSEATDKTIVMGGTTGGATVANYGTSTTLTLNGNIQANSTSAKVLSLNDKNGSITVNGTIANDVSGNAVSLVKVGALTVTLNSSNGYTGGTTITNGTMAIGNSGALGTGSLTVSGTTGATLMANSNVIVANNIANNITGTGNSSYLAIASLQSAGLTNAITGLISGTGGVRANTSGSRTELLNANNSFGGGLKVQNGTFVVANMGNAGFNSAIGTNGTVILGDSTSNGFLIWGNNQNETSDKVIAMGGTTGGAGIYAQNNGKTLTLNSALSVTGVGNKTLSMGGDGDITFNGLIADGSGSVINARSVGTTTNTRTTTLGNANNSFTGAVVIDASAPASASVTNYLSVAGIGEAGNNSYLGKASSINIGGNAAGSTAMLKYTGAGETSGKVINMNGTNGNAGIEQSGTGLLKFTNNFTATTAGDKSFVLSGSTAGTGEIGGAIVNGSTGSTGLKKEGSGTWTLSGSNRYSGATTVAAGTLSVASTGNISSSSGTTVNGGTLIINGSAGQVVVNTGGSLGGSGTVGAVNLNSGSFLKPGNSPGNLTAASSVWNAGATYQWQIASASGVAGTDWDLFTVNGTLDLSNLSSSSQFNLALDSGGVLAGFDGTSDYSWTFAQAAGLAGVSAVAGTDITSLFAINSALFNAGNGPQSGFKVLVGDTTGGLTSLNIAVVGVPEPSTGALIGFGAIGLTLVRGFRRRQS